MKKFNYIFFIVIVLLSSCSEDLMDHINKNPNNPTSVKSQFLLTEIQTAIAFSLVGGDYCYYSTAYVEHKVGIYNQLYSAEIRSTNATSATTLNNGWNSAYSAMLACNEIIKKCSEGGDEVGNFPALGMAQILKAHIASVLTDAFGDIPYTESTQPGVIFTPVLDKQEAIYQDIFTLLDDGIENLGKETVHDPITNQDFFYGGDLEAWERFANGLKARYTMRLSHKNPQYSKVIEYAADSFDEGEECLYDKFDGKSASNPTYLFYFHRDYFGSSLSLKEKIDARNDPRFDKFFVDYDEDTPLEFAPNGTPVQGQGKYGLSGLLDETAPIYILSYHELKFLEAEAYIRLDETDASGDAEAALKEAIKYAFMKVGLTEGQDTTYYNSDVKAKFDADPLSEIMHQKYFSFYDNESFEAFNDIRRWKAMGDNAIELKNPNFFPLRFPYGSSDVTTNKNVRTAYGNGDYVKTENVWWAGGTR